MIFLKTRKSRKKILSKKMVFLKIRKSRKKFLERKRKGKIVVSPTQSYKRMMQKLLHQTNLMLNREKKLFHLSNDVFQEYNI